jgi:hypothetical protein
MLCGKNKEKKQESRDKNQDKKMKEEKGKMQEKKLNIVYNLQKLSWLFKSCLLILAS